MSLGCNILLFPELEVKTVMNHVTKSYIRAIWLSVFSWQLLIPFLKYSNRTDVGICFSYSAALAPIIRFSYVFLFSVVWSLPRQSLPWCQSAELRGAEPAEGSLEWAPECWGTGEQGGNGARELENILKEPSDLCLHSLKMLWTPDLSHELRTVLSTFFPVKHCTNPGVCGQHKCCSASVLELAAHTSFWNYNCLCQQPALSIKHELSQEYPSLLIFPLLAG